MSNSNENNNENNRNQNGGKAKRKVSAKQKAALKANPWLAHVKATMKKHPNKKFKDVLKEAAKTYKK